MAAPPPPPPPPAPTSFSKPNNGKLLESIHKGIGLKKVPESERNDRSVLTVSKKSGGSATPLTLPPGSRGPPGSSLSIADALKARQEGKNKANTEAVNSAPFVLQPKRAGAPAPNAKVNIITNAPKPPSQTSKPSTFNSESNSSSIEQSDDTMPRVAPFKKPFLQTPMHVDSPNMSFPSPPKPFNNSSSLPQTPSVKVGNSNKSIAPSPPQLNYSSKPFAPPPEIITGHQTKPFAPPPPPIIASNFPKPFVSLPPAMSSTSTKPFAPMPPIQKNNSIKPLAPPPILAYKPTSSPQMELKTQCPGPTFPKKRMDSDGSQSPRKVSFKNHETIIPVIPPPTINGSVTRTPSFAPPPPPPVGAMPNRAPPIISTKKPSQTSMTNNTAEAPSNRPPLPSRDETFASFDSRFTFFDETFFPDPSTVIKRTKQTV